MDPDPNHVFSEYPDSELDDCERQYPNPLYLSSEFDLARGDGDGDAVLTLLNAGGGGGYLEGEQRYSLTSRKKRFISIIPLAKFLCPRMNLASC